MPFEDDLLLFLGIETVCKVKFFNRVQFGDAVFHSRKYKRVTRRNNFTVTYQQQALGFHGNDRFRYRVVTVWLK